jgi:transcriptional regulator with XRE-family HTH domain
MSVERRRQEVSQRRLTVAKLWTRRLTQEEIAAAVGVDQSTISRDIKALMAAWQKEAVSDVTLVRARELADLDAMEREAAMAASVKVSPQELARLLEVRLRVKERRARLLGLDAPQRREVTGKEGGAITHEYDFSCLSDEELEAEIIRTAESIAGRTAPDKPLDAVSAAGEAVGVS